MIAVLSWVDGFGADTSVWGIFKTIEEAQAHYAEYKDRKDRHQRLRYQKFTFGAVDFDWYEAKELFPKKKGRKYND